MRTRLASEFFVDPYWRTAALRPNRAEMSRAAFVGLVAGVERLFERNAVHFGLRSPVWLG